MKKSVSFDLSSDRLIQTAENLIDSHDYLSALKILNKNAERNPDEAYVHMLYAQIFDDLELHERCINEWFKFIALYDGFDDEDLYDAYEGLAVSFMNIGDEHFSAYYYDKALALSGDIPEDMRLEIIDSFTKNEKNPLKFVYPPEIADYSEILSNGIDYLKQNEFDSAIAEFDKVDSRNKSYAAARNLMAMSYMLSDRADAAEKECLNILDIKPNDVQALTTLAAVKTEQGKKDESRQYAARLLKLNAKNSEELFKIATVCCENDMHEEAHGIFLKLENEMPYDSSVLYFTAVSAYNCGRFDKCLSTFDKMLILNPYAVTAAFYRDKASIAIKKNKPVKMSYFYRLPPKERESTLKVLAALVALPHSQIKEMVEIVDVSRCIRWCFDESEGVGNSELHTLGAVCAARARQDDIVCDFLLNAFVEDEAKMKVLTELGERNEESLWNVVICNMNRSVAFRQLELHRLKRKPFIAAYAYLAAHFALINDKISEKFAVSCTDLYKKLEAEDRLKDVKSSSLLSAAIFLNSGVKLPHLSGREEVLKFFGVNGKEISDIYGV